MAPDTFSIFEGSSSEPIVISNNPTQEQYDQLLADGLISRHEGWGTDYFLVVANGRKYVYQEHTFSGTGTFLKSFDANISDDQAFANMFESTTTRTAAEIGQSSGLAASPAKTNESYFSPTGPGFYRKPSPPPYIRPISRPLTSGEVEMLEKAFAGNLDTTELQIAETQVNPFNPYQATTPYLTPMFPPAEYVDDFSKAGIGSQHLFVHEMTHVLQTQQGNSNVGSFFYHLVGHGFQYERCYHFDENELGTDKPLHAYNFEAQASIVANKYIIDNYPEFGHYFFINLANKKGYNGTVGNFQTQPPNLPRASTFEGVHPLDLMVMP